MEFSVKKNSGLLQKFIAKRSKEYITKLFYNGFLLKFKNFTQLPISSSSIHLKDFSSIKFITSPKRLLFEIMRS